MVSDSTHKTWLLSFLCNTAVLRWSFAAYVLLTLAFGVVMWIWDFQVIDEIFLRQDIINAVVAMDDTQRQVHAVTTATLDVAYPFAYGAFQAGMAYRYLGRWGRWIAPLSLICIPVDLVEGFAQVMILSDQMRYVTLKTVATPIKLALYVPGLIAALIALWIAARESRRGRVR